MGDGLARVEFLESLCLHVQVKTATAELKLLLAEFPEERHSYTVQKLEKRLHDLLNARQGPVHVPLPSEESPAWGFRGVLCLRISNTSAEVLQRMHGF